MILNKPKVKKFIGKVKKCTSGFITRFTTPRRSPAKNAIWMRLSVVGPDISIKGSVKDATAIANVVKIHLNNIFRSPIYAPYL